MRVLKHPLFLVAIVIATALYSANRFEVPLPNWMYFYVNDFLCMPIVLSTSLAVLRIINKTEALYVPIGIVLALTMYFLIYFEWLMPQINTRYTSDLIDVGLYVLGGLLFFRFQKQLF